MPKIRRSTPFYGYLGFFCNFLPIEHISKVAYFTYLSSNRPKNTQLGLQTSMYHDSIIIRKIRPKWHKHESSHNYKAKQKSKNKQLFLTLYKVFKKMAEGFKAKAFSHKHTNNNDLFSYHNNKYREQHINRPT